MSLPHRHRAHHAKPSLRTARFFFLNACYFALCCSLASFFTLQEYAASLGVKGVENGFLLGIVGLGALLARPFIAPHLGSLRACLTCLAVSTALLVASLACYGLASGFGSLLFARFFNGICFGGFFCALTALSPYAFPASRSGRAFSLLAISSLIPFLLLPPALNWMQDKLGISFAMTVLLMGLPAVFAAPAAIVAFRRAEREPSSPPDGLPLSRCLAGLLRPWMLASLFAAFSFYFSYAWVFYNADSVCKAEGVSNPGVLLSLATLVAILFRLLAQHLLDSFMKTQLLVAALLLNALATAAFCVSGLPWWSFFIIFGAFGLAWGAAVPLLSSAVMERSPHDEQGFNLNAACQMQDLGYFLGPLFGGAFKLCFLLPLLGFACALGLLRKEGASRPPVS